MKAVRPIWFDRLIIFLANAGLLFGSFFLLVSEISDTEPFIQAPVSRVNGAVDTLQGFSKAFIAGPGSIHITNPSLATRYLAPRTMIDPVHALLFFLSSVIIVAFFWDFSYKNPFTKKALLGLQIGVGLILFFMVGNFFRHDWFGAQVELLTKGEFSYNKPFPLVSPEFIVLFILLRISWIFNKGIGLQRDVDSTV